VLSNSIPQIWGDRAARQAFDFQEKTGAGDEIRTHDLNLGKAPNIKQNQKPKLSLVGNRTHKKQGDS
jgi:hypothetical protein